MCKERALAGELSTVARTWLALGGAALQGQQGPGAQASERGKWKGMMSTDRPGVGCG